MEDACPPLSLLVKVVAAVANVVASVLLLLEYTGQGQCFVRSGTCYILLHGVA